MNSGCPHDPRPTGRNGRTDFPLPAGIRFFALLARCLPVIKGTAPAISFPGTSIIDSDTGMKLMGKILPFFTVFLGCLLSSPAANTPSDSIPFELGPASRIYVKGSVNGSRPLRFLFHTRATAMVISTHSLKGVPMEFSETLVNHGATGSAEARTTNSPSGDDPWSMFPLSPFRMVRTSRTACWACGSSGSRSRR